MKMSGDSVASSHPKVLDAMKSKYMCIQEPLPAAAAAAAADGARPDNNRRYLTSLRVFGSREVDEQQSSQLANPQGVKDKVTSALKALSFREPRVLVQFWSPVSVRKRWLLTTLDQPFGLGVVDEGLYLYRLESEKHAFVVDEEHKEELGLPARVYRQKLPEWCLDMNDPSTRQHWTASYNIHGYINLPVFEPDSGGCVGVVEIITSSKYVDFAFEVQQISRALKKENLKSPNVFEDTNSYARVGDEKRQLELDGIYLALKMVCDIHNLPLAQTWGPCGYSSIVANSGNLMRSCSSFSRNCIGKVCMSTAGLPIYVQDLNMWEFHETCRSRHLDKSQGVVGRSLSSRGLCFCGDVSQLGDEDYPLAHYARMHGITSCLAIYLKGLESDDDEYVVELFLPTQIVNDLQSLVKTVKQYVENASGIQLGDMSSIQDIGGISLNSNLDFSTLTEIEELLPELENLPPLIENEKLDCDVNFALSEKQKEFAYVEEDYPITSVAAGKRRERYVDYSEKPVRKRKRADTLISLEQISKHFGKTLREAAKSLSVKRSKLKRIYKSHGINTQLTNASMEEIFDNFTVNVIFKESIVQFAYLLSDGLLSLENKVAKSFTIEGRRARLKYWDEEEDLILICNDDDLKLALDTSRGKFLICKPDDM